MVENLAAVKRWQPTNMCSNIDGNHLKQHQLTKEDNPNGEGYKPHLWASQWMK